MKADLHSHSTYSDGKSTVLELVKRAKDKGIDILALTDHDTTYGDLELDELENKYNIKLIKGIELSCEFNKETIHLVGLFKNNYVPKYMYEFSDIMIERRKNRAINLAKNINDIYKANIDIDLLIKENKIITRKNILNHLLKYCNVDEDNAKFYVSKKSKAYIPSIKVDLNDGIKLLHDNNALVILAHPCLVTDENVKKIVKLGIDGIEAKYANKINDYDYFNSLAIENDLFVSAGSDYHGDNSHGDIGDVYLKDEEVKLILDKLGIKI